MAIGSTADVINAKRVKLILDPTGTNQEFVLLQELTMPLNRPETREAIAGGSVYFYGQHENSFDATILLSANDIGTFLDFNLLVNGAIVQNTYDIQLTSKANNVSTIRVKAVTPEQEIQKLPTGGVKIRQTFRIVEDVNSNNVI